MATELILAKSIEELTPALIAFNNEDLMAYASRVVEKYSGRTYSDEEMKDAKEDRATIRKIIDSLNGERIRIKKIYNAPMDKFTAQINEVVDLLNAGLKGIDEQVKAKEKADKEKKEAILREYFTEIVGDLAGCIAYEQIADSRWLNATTTESKAKKEMEAKLEVVNNDVNVIKGLASEDEAALLSFYFRTLNLAKALQENERLKRDRQIALEYQRRREEAMAKTVVEQLLVKSESVPPAVTEKEEKTEEIKKEFTVILEVTGTPEAMKKLLDYIKENKIACKAMKKE